jgi:hypothetical protein
LGPIKLVQSTACSIVDHADIVQALVITEKLSPPRDLAWENVTLLPHLHHLFLHQFMLDRIPVLLLWFQERHEGAGGVVGLPVAIEPLIPLTPVPEKRCGALRPLKPGSIGATTDCVQPRPHHRKTVRQGAQEQPLSPVSGPSLGGLVVDNSAPVVPTGNSVSDHLTWGTSLVDLHVSPPPGVEALQQVSVPPT